MKAQHLAIGFLGLFVAACASYDPSSAPAPAADSADWTGDGTLAVGADPITESERQKAIFDADLHDAGIIAIQVVARNEGSRPMLVRPSDMTLELPDDQSLLPSGVTSVVNKVGEDGSVVGAALAFGLIGLIAASNAEDNAREARTADYRQKAFKRTTLRDGDSAHGFVFFIPPPDTAPFDQATLHVRFVDVDGATSTTVEAPVTGLRYVSAAKQDRYDDPDRTW